MNHVTKGLMAIAAVGFIAGPTAANAGWAYQGSDKTNYVGGTGGGTMTVCDEEADGHGVHGDFRFNYNYDFIRYDESGGADSACDSKKAGTSGIQGLYQHRTVEERDDAFDLDEKGEWHRHS